MTLHKRTKARTDLLQAFLGFTQTWSFRHKWTGPPSQGGPGGLDLYKCKDICNAEVQPDTPKLRQVKSYHKVSPLDAGVWGFSFAVASLNKSKKERNVFIWHQCGAKGYFLICTVKEPGQGLTRAPPSSDRPGFGGCIRAMWGRLGTTVQMSNSLIKRGQNCLHASSDREVTTLPGQTLPFWTIRIVLVGPEWKLLPTTFGNIQNQNLILFLM